MYRKCFLCSLENSEFEPVYAFNAESFKNIYLKLLFRKKKNFKYNDVEFSRANNSKVGYHSMCYKKVTVMLRKYREEYAGFCKKHESDEPIVRSERYSLMEDEDWRTRGGSIWNQPPDRERSTTRVKCRATTCQLVQLVKFMEKHPQLAVSHTRPFPGSDELWMKLAEHINQFGPPKNYKQCKTTWRDLRKRAFAMQRGRNRKSTGGRNLYGMAPKIISLITNAGGAAFDAYKDAPDDEDPPASSSKTESPAPQETPSNPVGDETGVIKVERTSGPSGDQLVIRVTDKLDSKTNVFNRFTINDGHFENNITVKEEIEERFNHEEEQEPMEAEAEDDGQDRSEEMFPAAEAILGDTDNIMEEKNNALRDLNETLRKFIVEYKTRNALMRERIDLERARLQFDMEVYRNRQVEKRAIIQVKQAPQAPPQVPPQAPPQVPPQAPPQVPPQAPQNPQAKPLAPPQAAQAPQAPPQAPQAPQAPPQETTSNNT